MLKYRGTAHGMNGYSLLSGAHGFSVLPITSLQLDHPVSSERIATGIARLDEMPEGKGVFRASSVLISGSSGTGKSSIAAKLVEAACERGERALFFAYEESAAQIIRNMRSINIDLATWVKKGLLQIHSSRPALYRLEQHLVMMHESVRAFRPTIVAVDPVSNLTMGHDKSEVNPTLMRLIDFLKQEQTTAVFTNLTSEDMVDLMPVDSQLGVSLLTDTWLLLRNVEYAGDRNRTIFALKTRGMAHSNQVREFVLSDGGIDLVDVHLSDDGFLTGRARIAQEDKQRVALRTRHEDRLRALRQLESKQKTIGAQIAALQADSEAAHLAMRQESLQAASAQNPAVRSRHEGRQAGCSIKTGLVVKKSKTSKTKAEQTPAAITAPAAVHYVPWLYISGSSPRCIRAIPNIQAMRQEHLNGRYDLEVVNVSQHPMLAAGEQIIAAPTLIKKLPLPVRRFTGDISATARILSGLDLRTSSGKASEYGGS